MKLGHRKASWAGVSLCTLIMFCGGAKLATLLPLTDAGQMAWATAFSTSAEAAQVTGVSEADLPEEAPEPGEALRIIARERALLTQQKAALHELDARIAVAREALRVEAERLNVLKTEVEAVLAKAESRHAADIAKLVDLYGGMKPKEAAGLLMQMDLEVAVYVITEMDPRRGAPILAEMPSQIAQAISRVMLERGKLPGDQKPVQVQLR